ncbi:MAG: DUF2764 family protein [Clostridia bacterium]|nr:DUF2764 family protein [Clostridia bacterium]
MAEYYLVSQLPSLDGIGENTPMPITEERFDELCERFLGKKTWDEMKKITLVPTREPVSTGSGFIDAWLSAERLLRLALAKVRAERMKKSFDTGDVLLPAEYLKAAAMATETENPMEAENYLNSFRLTSLEGMRPSDSFSTDYIFYYAIKLKLLWRIRGFDKSAGEAAYKNIYGSVLDRADTEVIE